MVARQDDTAEKQGATYLPEQKVAQTADARSADENVERWRGGSVEVRGQRVFGNVSVGEKLSASGQVLIGREATHSGRRELVSRASTVRLIAVAISSCEVYGQQKLRIPLMQHTHQRRSPTLPLSNELRVVGGESFSAGTRFLHVRRKKISPSQDPNLNSVSIEQSTARIRKARYGVSFRPVPSLPKSSPFLADFDESHPRHIH